MGHSVVPPELLPIWREAAYALYCRLCATRGQLPLPRDLHLPTPAAVLISNLLPHTSQQQVINVFSGFGRITMVEGPQVFNVFAPAPGPGGPFHPPVMRPVALVQARLHYTSRDDAIMAWATFSTFDPQIHSMPPVVAIANGFLFVTLEVHALGDIPMPGQYAGYH
ncbi:hypothetical protein COCOBI_08-6150 [Coccomyxa sp. Obi]|nr:hypothetical protein COCOBI_08-6150 [Coccomyxa sp. Obi]